MSLVTMAAEAGVAAKRTRAVARRSSFFIWNLAELIPVMRRLERSFLFNTQIVSLFFRQLGQVNAELVEVQAGNFFVEVLGEDVDLVLVVLVVVPQFELRQYLVRKGGAHD